MLKIKKTLKENYTAKVIPELETTVEIVMTETDLSFEFFCKKSQFFSAGDTYNAPLFDGDVCEAFICTSGNIKDYYEIEVAPNGCIFLYKMHNIERGVCDETPVPLSENFVKSEVERFGDDYRLKFSMSLDKIGYDPKVGILFNAFRIETEGGHTDMHLMSFNPTMCETFHCPEYFVKLDENLK